jgi:osomolarity two-component system sensor histidine kinase NIK1
LSPSDELTRLQRMDVNLTGQIRSIGIVIREVALGNFGWMVDAHMSGEIGDIKDTLNGMVGRLQTFSSEVNRLALEVGTEGGLRRSAVVPGAQGAWGDLTDNLNVGVGSFSLRLLC